MLICICKLQKQKNRKQKMSGNIQNFQKDPSQPEVAPHVDQETAGKIGKAMVEAAASGVKAAADARAAEQEAQLSRPLQDGAITEVPR